MGDVALCAGPSDHGWALQAGVGSEWSSPQQPSQQTETRMSFHQQYREFIIDLVLILAAGNLALGFGVLWKLFDVVK